MLRIMSGAVSICKTRTVVLPHQTLLSALALTTLHSCMNGLGVRPFAALEVLQQLPHISNQAAKAITLTFLSQRITFDKTYGHAILS